MAETKECEFCGQTIHRPARADNRDWRGRRFCNTSCAKRASKKVHHDSKPCSYCGATIVRQPAHSNRDWADKKYCNGSCANGQKRDMASQPRTCEACGEVFHRKSGVSSVSWAIMKTCSPACLTRHRSTPIIEAPSVEVLRELYEDKKLSRDAIGEMFGVANVTANRWLRRAGIKLRRAGIGLESRGIEPPTRDDLEEMVHGRHMPYAEIAKIYGVDGSAVMHWLIKHEIRRPTLWETRYGQNQPSLPDADALRELYASGLSSDAIGAQCGVSGGKILTLCREFGIDTSAKSGGFGNACVCKDGTRVRSSYEMIAANWLIDHAIPFTYEPKLPFQSSWLADFLANDWYVEIWGLVGWPRYDRKRELKTAWYERHGIPLIDVMPEDFARPGRLARILSSTMEPPRSGSAGKEGLRWLNTPNRPAATRQLSLFD